MADLLLTFYCAAVDQESIAEALRPHSTTPLHLREERVLGRDFEDARAPEQVRGLLRRAAIDLVIDETEVETLVEAATQARRGHPVRWQTVAIAARGRFE